MATYVVAMKKGTGGAVTNAAPLTSRPHDIKVRAGARVSTYLHQTTSQSPMPCRCRGPARDSNHSSACSLTPGHDRHIDMVDFAGNTVELIESVENEYDIEVRDEEE